MKKTIILKNRNGIFECAKYSDEMNASFGFSEEVPDDFPTNERGEHMASGNERLSTMHESTNDNDTPMIDNFGVDITRLAEENLLDPVVGRDSETDRIALILCRRKKNNPILLGEPGVGKSAIVEGLATRIVSRRVPHILLNKRLIALDMAAMVAGTQYRGQFEQRVQKLIKELKHHKEIILFIDEIHTIIGAGAAPGSLDAANILKPALARGEIQCIGATTIGEYKKSIEKDGALERRFQKILVEPTSQSETLEILQNISKRYEEHHSVRYSQDALRACVSLSHRYITNRAFPDKAIDVMDEAGSRANLFGAGVPIEIEEKEREIAMLKIRKKEAALQQDYEMAARLRDALHLLNEEYERLHSAWKERLKQDYRIVDEEQVALVISNATGVPVAKMLEQETKRLQDMPRALSTHVIAQDEAISKLSRAIARSRIGLKGTDRPIGTFMFVGPTGVGKTHLAKCLAEWMFGSKDALIRVDMSEYGEKHSMSRLMGAPPGYVGYEEGGQLTEKVRRKPYSVILLDEIEKAHSEVFNTLLQVMDEGRMTDGNGTTVDFRNTLIIMTSNSGSRQLKDFGGGIGFNTSATVSPAMAESIVRKTLQKQFAPEFLNRIDDIIMFQPINKESARKIVEKEIDELCQRTRAQGYNVLLTDNAISWLVDSGFDAQFGARSLKRTITKFVEDPLCEYVLNGRSMGNVLFDVEQNELQIVQESIEI